MSFADISSNSPMKQLFKPKSTVFSWELLVLQLLFLAVVALMMEKPTGSLCGRVAVEEKGFNLSTYNLRENHVYAMVNGPRGGIPVERGVWVKSDGTFELDQLPVGEYSLRVRAPGFSTNLVSGLFVEEGHISKLPKPVALTLLNPTVNIASESRVFTSKEHPHFWINASGASQATVKIYKKNLFDLISPQASKRYGLSFASDFGMFVVPSTKSENPFQNQQPVKSFTRKLFSDSSDDAYAEFKFDTTLPKGDYFAVAEVLDPFGKNSARTITWFSISDIGLIVKYAPDKAIVRAIDLNTLKGVSGVNIQFANKLDTGALATVATAVTAGSGMATVPFTPTMRRELGSNLVVTGELGKDKAYGGFSDYRSDNDTHKTYFYTDRPVYRLGQTVYFKGISRLVDEHGIANIGEGKSLQVAIEDPENNELQTFQIKTNKHGTFHGLFNIPIDGKTGGYQVQITYPDGHVDYSAFEIAEYRKPEYQVEVKALSDRFVEGETAKFKVKASYFFGGPVANARIKYHAYASTDYATRWRLMSRPSYYNFFDDWTDEGGAERTAYEGTGDYIAEGFAVTDANGEATVTVATKAAEPATDSPPGQEYNDKILKLETEVTDISRLSVTGSGSVSLTPGNYFLTATPTNYVITTGESVGLDVVANDYNGKIVANAPVKVKMVRFPYDRIKSEYKTAVVLSETSATTDATGKAHIDIAVGGQMPSDNYYLEVTGKDKENHLVGDNANVWVANSQTPFSLSLKDAQAEPLTIKLDKKVYKPGDTVRAIIAGPFNGSSGMDAIVSVEGRTLHDLKVVPLTSSAQMVEIPVKAEYAPNFYLGVAMVGENKQFYTETEIVQVSPASHFLKLALTTDKERYKPGETVNYTVSARDTNNKPVKDVELSLGVVDESIYSIRAETAADITKFFYDKVPNWVTTLCSFPEQYSGGPDKDEPRVRKDFKDTAAWVPELSTDDKGEAHAAIKLPDNLTTWRATVRGINMGTEVGATINKVIASQDIIARLALPRFFSTGDQGLVTAVVHNYSGKQQKINVKLTITPKGGSSASTLTLGQMPATTLDLASDAAGRISFPVTAGTTGTVKIKLVATCPSGGDALEKELYVKPMGIPVTIVSSGLLTKDSDQASINLELPPGLTQADKLTRVLSLATSSIGPVMGNFNSLIDYPYGCTEQTMSRLVPSTVAMQLNKKLNAPLNKADISKFSDVYKKALEKLTDYEHADGGWGWWQTDDTNPYLTALVVEGFKNLQNAGYTVPQNLPLNGLKWMSKAMGQLADQLADPMHVKDVYIDAESKTDLAYMLYASSLWPPQAEKAATRVKGKASLKVATVNSEAKAFTYMLSQRDKLQPEALAYLARALELRGKHDQALKCIDRLIALSNNTEATVDWEHTAAMMHKLSIADNEYFSYRFTAEETTALAIQALIEVTPADQVKSESTIEKAKAWLFMQRGKDGWGSTKTTAAVFKALLADELKARGQGQAASANGIENISVNLADTLLQQFNLAASSYAPETNMALSGHGKLDISKNGSGRLYYSITTNYYQSLDGANAKLSMANMPADLTIERKFFHLTTSATTSDGVIHVKAIPITDGKIKAGETVLMKVQVSSPRTMPYVMVQCDLPSGAEVVQSENEAAAEEADNDDRNAITGDWGTPWWTHQDILDDKIVFFGTNLHSGKSEFTTLLRMELPGNINVNPVMLEGMYTKGIKGFSNPLIDKLQVSE